MHNYFYKIFPGQLKQLEFQRPNQIVRENVMQDESVIFFGGENWESVTDDLARIPADDRPRFILSLFMIVLTDQCLYSYQQDAYQSWRQRTRYPKFGWSGFGPHNENPLKILWAPERENVVEADQLINLIPEFVDFLFQVTNHFFAENFPGVNTAEYFEAMGQDNAFQFNQGSVVTAFKEEFRRRTNPL